VSDDPYVYPGTEVLRNMPGIRNADELQRFEAHLTFLNGLQLLHEPIAGEYDLAHLRAFHQYLLSARLAARRPAGQRRRLDCHHAG